MSYLLKVVEKFPESKDYIIQTDWISQITVYLRTHATSETAQQSVIALFSHLLEALDLQS